MFDGHYYSRAICMYSHWINYLLCKTKKIIKKAHFYFVSLYLSVTKTKTKLGIMQKIQLKAEYHNLLCRASNKEAQKAKPLSLTIFPTLSTVLQFSLACAVALQIRKSWTDSNKRQLSNSEGQLSQTSNFLRFVQNKFIVQNTINPTTNVPVARTQKYPLPQPTPLLLGLHQWAQTNFGSSK